MTTRLRAVAPGSDAGAVMVYRLAHDAHAIVAVANTNLAPELAFVDARLFSQLKRFGVDVAEHTAIAVDAPSLLTLAWQLAAEAARATTVHLGDHEAFESAKRVTDCMCDFAERLSAVLRALEVTDGS